MASSTTDSLGAQILEHCVALDALKFGEFKLVSGLTSKYYFDGRLLTMSPVGANLVAQALLPAIRESGAQAVGVGLQQRAHGLEHLPCHGGW